IRLQCAAKNHICLRLTLYYDYYHPPRDPHPFPTRRSSDLSSRPGAGRRREVRPAVAARVGRPNGARGRRARTRGTGARAGRRSRSEEHTSELQSRSDLVCRLLLEKKKQVDMTKSSRESRLK